MEALTALDITLDAMARLRRIWSLRDQMSAYDAAYAAAAEALDTPLITVDERLRRACNDAGIPAIGLDVQPQKGGAVYFVKTDADLAPDRRPLPAGLPVVKGGQVVAHQWRRERTHG